jgi:intermembrane space import and assembly protein 40
MYGSELEDDEDEVEEEIHAREAEQASGDASARKEAAHPTEQRRQVEEPYRDTVKTPRESVSKEADQSDEVLARVARVPEQPHRDSSKTTAETTQKAGDEGGDLLPKAAHDASSK